MMPADIILSSDQFLLVILLVKVGVMASLATILVRYRFFRRILLIEERGRREDWQFAALFGAFIALGIVLRLVLGYTGADISLPGLLLVGLLTGPLIGAAAGAAIGVIPALNGEILAFPMDTLYGLAGGLVSLTCPTRNAVWNFSPITLMNVYRFLKQRLMTKRPSWQVALIAACVAMEGLTIRLGQRFASEEWLFSLIPETALATLCVFVSTVACLGIPLKIWNSTRIEMLLEKQEALVNQARFEALRNQINPHFLFNTLNSISATVRTNPLQARQIILKLSNILRRLLHTEEALVTVREELAFIDAYLDIERVRFGKNKLKIEREIDAHTLDLLIPSMVLQPLVENAIKHGISPKISGGTIRISSRRENGHVVLEVEDDGEGVPDNQKDRVLTAGIGLSNVNSRLQVLFGPGCRFAFDSRHHHGTRVRIEIPDRLPEPFVLQKSGEA